jgi:hypothetical protein
MMMNVGFIQYGNNVKTGHKNNNNACVRDMQVEQHIAPYQHMVFHSTRGCS